MELFAIFDLIHTQPILAVLILVAVVVVCVIVANQAENTRAIQALQLQNKNFVSNELMSSFVAEHGKDTLQRILNAYEQAHPGEDNHPFLLALSKEINDYSVSFGGRRDETN